MNSLRKALTEAPVLVIYYPDKPTEVWADASKENETGEAAVMQDHRSGLQPLALCSTVVDIHQIDDPRLEQELLALRLLWRSGGTIFCPWSSSLGLTATV